MNTRIHPGVNIQVHFVSSLCDINRASQVNDVIK
jgi:hypothetical protein